MAEPSLPARAPLTHVVVPGRHGRSEGPPGVTLAVCDGLGLTLLMARNGTGADLQRVASTAGAELPAVGCSTVAGGFAILWSGPAQWLVVSETADAADVEKVLAACRPHAAVIDQGDARAIIEVAGPQPRSCLAKGFSIDLHPSVFAPGRTALTTAAAVSVQIWQRDAAPTYRIAVPRSFAEGFWHWLTEAAAEYGVSVDDRR